MNALTKIFSISVLIATCMVLMSCTVNTLPLEEMQSKNYGQRIKFLIMHYTADDYQGSVRALVDKGGVSSHYLLPESHDKTYLDDELKVLKLVNEDERAWHAGNSYWQGRKGINDQSIGIEIVNVSNCERLPQDKSSLVRGQDISDGQMCFFRDFDPKQIDLLIKLSKEVLKNNPDISPTNIIGHSDVAPLRKGDPGPRFPWYQLYQAGIGAWYDKETVLKYWQLFDQQKPSIALVQQALKSYGYNISQTGELDQQTQAVLHAFQTHFVPWKITDSANEQTVATLFALLEKYMSNSAETLFALYQNELTPNEQVQEYIGKRGQIDVTFPEHDLNTSDLMKGRATFKSYQGRGEIIIENQEAISADIFINGEKISIATPLQAYNTYRYSLKKRTKNGDNTFRIENILPEGASLNVTIPFSTIKDKSQKPKQDFSKVDELINDDVKNGFPSAVLVVLKDGEILKNSAYGYARKYTNNGEPLESAIKMSNDVLFDIGSMTKIFATKFALMKLASEGKLNINLPIKHYLPRFRGDGREFITVKDILTRKKGAAHVKFFTRENHLGSAYFSQNVERTKKLVLTKVPYSAQASTMRESSDIDYMLLGILIEKIADMSLDNYIENNIYHPLGLSNTVFNPLRKGFRKNQFAATKIHGITHDNKVDFENARNYILQGEVGDDNAFHSLDGVAGHAGVFSTGQELAVLVQVLLNRGGYSEKQLFSENIIDQFIKNDYPLNELATILDGNDKHKRRFGSYASSKAFGHIDRAGTFFVIDPEHDLAIILLTNAQHNEVQEQNKEYPLKQRQFKIKQQSNVISHVYEAVLNN